MSDEAATSLGFLASRPDSRPAPQEDEPVLIRAAQSGSEKALEELFRRHWPSLYRAAYLIVRDAGAAEDIAQESYLAALRSLGRFDRHRPLRPWLHRIAVNRAIDWDRARKARAEVGVVAERDDRDGSGRNRSAGLSDELMDALSSLSPEQRAVVVLRHLLEYTPGEIASILELPRGTVNSRLRRALDQLSEIVKEDAP